MRDRLRTLIFWLLRVPCAAFGGEIPREPGQPPMGRWCPKPFGHSDSCYYEPGPQPLWEIRQRAKGHKIS